MPDHSEIDDPAADAPDPGASTGSRERAAALLVAPSALLQLSLDEARVVVDFMQPMRIEAGTRFIQEGDTDDSGFMLLVLQGEVTVESAPLVPGEAVTINVLGAGSLIGEIGLVDNAPRSASCTASTALTCAILAREDLQRLISQHPSVAAKLVLAISSLIAARLRRVEHKLKLYAQLHSALKQELGAASGQ